MRKRPPNGENSHAWKGGRIITGQGYIRVMNPGHGRSDKSTGYVFEHIVVAENALGRPLPPGAEIHHVNEVRSDNRNCNLVICENHAYHQLLHRRLHAYQACGDPAAVQCSHCKQWGRDIPRSGCGSAHRECKKLYQARWYQAKKRKAAAPHDPAECEEEQCQRCGELYRDDETDRQYRSAHGE